MDRYKVLVAHQDKDVCRNIKGLLEHFNLDFVLVHNGLDALAAAKYETPALIIANVNMDVLNSIEMAAMLKQDSNTADIPCIFLHDKLDYEIITRANQLGAKGFLMVPYLDNTLIYSVQRALPLVKSENMDDKFIKLYSITDRIPHTAS